MPGRGRAHAPLPPGAGRQNVGIWTLPGGGLGFGEDPARACLRELEEETGLLGSITSLAGVHSRLGILQRAGGPIEMHVIGILYRVAITGGTLRDEVDESTDRCAWFSSAEIVDLPLVDLVEAALPLFQPAPA